MGLLSFFKSRKRAEPVKPSKPAPAKREEEVPEGPEDTEISFKDEMMIVMHCPECGKALEGNRKVCVHCGAKLG